MVNLTCLVLLGLFLIAEGISRLFEPESVDGWTVVLIAGVALLVNIATVMLTFRHRGQSLNIRAVVVDNMADAAGSFGVLVSGALVLLYGWYLADVIATLSIAGYMVVRGATLLPRAIDILMQRVPPDLDVDQVAGKLKTIDGVLDVHHIHIWEIDEHRRSLEAHIVIDPADLERMETIKQALKQCLAGTFDITHSTLEFEFATRESHS